jgi:hypothetical protein
MIRILNTFYNDILKETSAGSVDCLFKFNMCFSTYLCETKKIIPATVKSNNYFIPVLIINNMDEFNKLLVEYVNLAVNFYKDDRYFEELNGETEEEYYKEKMVMTLLWSNASIEDFNHPEEFLRRRIEFIKNEFIENYDLGFSSVLKANIEFTSRKERIFNETPYSICFKAILNDEEYTFPVIRYGICDDIVYVYAIQRDDTLDKENKFAKKVNRSLYKVNEAVDIENLQYPNIMNVTSSFVVALDLFIWLFKNMGFNKFMIVDYLPTRWNAKCLKNSKNGGNGLTFEERMMKENAVKKFENTFYRVKYHNKEFLINSFSPFKSLEIYANDGNANNEILSEMITLSKKYKRY